VVEKHPEKPSPDMPSAEHGALVQLERSAVIAALRKLPGRQREGRCRPMCWPVSCGPGWRRGCRTGRSPLTSLCARLGFLAG
jgi:hypothetical protein